MKALLRIIIVAIGELRTKQVPYVLLIATLLFTSCVTSYPLSGGESSQQLPRLILISMDGFRHNYLDKFSKDEVGNFTYFINNGVQARWVRNVFPSVTFPNHMSILTGLYPESHGVVDNFMKDPDIQGIFDMGNIEHNLESKWFDMGSEPIWVTNHKNGNGRYSGTVMWPGSVAPVQCVKPDRTIPNSFWGNETYPFNDRIDQLIMWFTDKKQPINFGMLYFPEPDEIGHHHGTDSVEIKEIIQKLDSALGYLKNQLERYNLIEKMNVVITADHGMTMFENNTINIDDIVDPSLYNFWDGALPDPVPKIQPNPGLEDEIFRKLENHPNFYAYRKGFPKLKALHYSDSNRIPEIVLEAKKGWIFINNQTNITSLRKGYHGYDPAKVPYMYPFFIASGPAFKRGVVVEPFDMVDIYPLMCHVLGLTPAPNNGSLRNVKSLLVNPPGGSFEATAATFLGVTVFAALLAGFFSIAAVRQSRSHRLRRGHTQLKGIPHLVGNQPHSALLDNTDDDEL